MRRDLDRQCHSCGGFCRPSGCERENVKPPVTIRTLSLSDRANILKLADACADNKDGFGFAFYNASIVRFAIAISRMLAGHEATEKDKSDVHGPDWTERDGEYLK